MSVMRSPNEMLAAAREHMLAGREPQTERDWMLVMNFFAANIAKGLEEATCKFLAMLFQIPLTDDVINQIASFQRERKTDAAV